MISLFFLDENNLNPQISREILKYFFDNEGVKEYIHYLAAARHKISRYELYFHLKTIHSFALFVVAKVYTKYNLMLEMNIPSRDYCRYLQLMVAELLKLNLDGKSQEDLAYFIKKLIENMRERDLATVYQLKDASTNHRFIFHGFPQAYINEIIKLTYPAGYVACFMDDYTNPVVWAHYGDGHQGVCLKYKTQDMDGYPAIALQSVQGWETFKFKKIRYANEFPPIDFFRSLGRLSKEQLLNQWYTDPQGNLSGCARHLQDERAQEIWRKNYWEAYEKSFFTKLKAWTTKGNRGFF